MNRLRLKNPLVLMPVINMAGAVSTFVYFYFIFPRITAERQLPWQYSVLFFLGGSLVLCLFFILLRKGSLRELGEVAEGMNRMIDSLRESRRAEEAFDRYMGNEIRDAILSGDVSLEGEMKRATLLFCDLRNFTGMVETTYPRQVVQILNQYFTEMIRAITDHKGLVLQYVGDEIEAVFGIPVAMDDHPEKAVQAALSAADLMVKDVLDVFALLKTPERIMATLRT